MKIRDVAMYVLGGLITVCFFVVLGLLIFKELPQGNKDLFNILLGALIGFMSSVVTYFYGSSAGSAKKDETIAAQSKELNKTNGQGG
jgi:hypothetical protein